MGAVFLETAESLGYLIYYKSSVFQRKRRKSLFCCFKKANLSPAQAVPGVVRIIYRQLYNVLGIVGYNWV